MKLPHRVVEVCGAIAILVAFGGLFIGRMMIYPVARAEGTFFERVASEATAWDWGHRVMLLGIVCVIPATLTLRHAFHQRSPLLTDIATVITLIGAPLVAGQYALDFAMLAAARMTPPEAAEQFNEALRSQPFVKWTFYKLGNLSQLALLLFTVSLWQQGAHWRWPATLATIAALTSLIGPQVIGSAGMRIALGLWFVAFAIVALKILRSKGELATGTVNPSGQLLDTLPPS